jgi:hypothetical protein
LVDDRTQLERLRSEFPLWEINSRWAAAASGPDFRLLLACRAGLRLAGFSAPELARMMTGAEARYGWPRHAG